MNPSHPLLPLLCELADLARTTVSSELRESTREERSRAHGHAGSDVIYAIDREVEHGLVGILSERAEALGGLVLVAEGIGEEELTFYPEGRADADCAWRLLMDPIDGTRGIMTDKRSAWFLAGAAPNRGPGTRLRDIDCAVMAELPTSRAAVADRFAAVRGQGVEAVRHHLISGAPPAPFTPEPFSGDTVRGGFAQISRFFPGGRAELAALDDELMTRLFPDASEGEVLCFEDQYISSGGQMAELIRGHDRFTADLRATLFRSAHFTGERDTLTCHPYDLSAALVAEEAGILLTGPDGGPLDAPFDTRTACDWIGYANPDIRAEVEPLLLDLLRERNWL